MRLFDFTLTLRFLMLRTLACPVVVDLERDLRDLHDLDFDFDIDRLAAFFDFGFVSNTFLNPSVYL